MRPARHSDEKLVAVLANIDAYECGAGRVVWRPVMAGLHLQCGSCRTTVETRSPGHGLLRPSFRRCYGPEFIAKAISEWIIAVDAKTAVTELGRPWENGYCEGFDARLRDELLNSEIYCWLAEGRVVIENWQHHYNTQRPHSSLGYRPPAPQAVQWPAPINGPASPATPTMAQRPTLHQPSCRTTL